jgi:gamma-glutamylcyclotransferase (GGCT)/AIG2-like uncharacterized protein YtfP
MQTKLYFAYGANMHPGYMSRRCPAAVAVKKMELQGWELRFYTHATILPKAHTSVPGILWTVTEECESLLDSYEGYPTYYTKRSWTQDGLDFFFYEMTPDHCKGNPGTGYVTNIIESYNTWDIAPDQLEDVLHATYTDRSP